MADAKALFKRHWETFREAVEHEPEERAYIVEILSACIVAEAIRNGLEDPAS